MEKKFKYMNIELNYYDYIIIIFFIFFYRMKYIGLLEDV